MRESYLQDLLEVLEYASVGELRGIVTFSNAYIKPPAKEARHEKS